jgi:hypothetical protein
VSECECGRQRPLTPQSRPALEAAAKFETAARFLLLLVMHTQRSARLAPLHRLLSLQSYHCFEKHSPAGDDMPSAPDVRPCSTCRALDAVRSPTCRAVLVRGQSALLLWPRHLARHRRTPPCLPRTGRGLPAVRRRMHLGDAHAKHTRKMQLFVCMGASAALAHF